MPRLGLALVILWFLSLFVFRTALQWWRTGSAGVHGFSGAVGSLEWSAGVLASLGLACGAATPVAALRGWPGGGLWVENVALHALGAGLASAGLAGALAAQLAMGDSWRIGVDDTERTALVTGGLFSWVRNPIFSFILASMVGLALVVPNAFALLAAALTFVGIEIQVRAVEEPHLRRAHGAAYDAYAARTGRFCPGAGLGPSFRARRPGCADGDRR